MPSRARPRPFPTDHGVYGSPGDVSPWDLRFDPSDRAHLDAEPDGRGRFRVWAEPGLSDGLLVVRTPGGVTGHPMEAVARTMRFTFWEGVAGPFPEGAEYSFAFRAAGGRGVYLVPSGVSNAVERIDRWPLDLPEPMTVPEWVRGAIIYQVFPERYASGDESLTPVDADPWGAPPRHRSFQGGDLPGITERIPHLVELGVDVLYLNPIFASPSNHRYDAVDYYEVDPALGGNEALRRLVETAHEQGLRVVLDASFNHVHPRFFAFQDLIRRGPRSRYRDWFVVKEWPLEVRVRRASAAGSWVHDWADMWRREVDIPVVEVEGDWPPVEPSYEAWYDVPTMPRVDLSHPEARAYMLEVAAYWVREYGIDGWRMDVARYVTPDFWDDFRAAVRAEDPDAYLLCEVMGDAGPWLQGDRFDATMNYTFRDIALRFFARDEISGEELLDDAARLWAQYPWPATLANQNLISSHDTPRFLTEAGGAVWRLRLATVFQMTFPGAPGIYYGDEVGMEGGEDPANRGAYPWHIDHAAHEVHRVVVELSRLRRRRPELVTGDWRPREGNGHVAAFERVLGRRRTTIVINRSSRPRRHALDYARPRLLWGRGRLVDGTVTVPGRSAVVVAG